MTINEGLRITRAPKVIRLITNLLYFRSVWCKRITDFVTMKLNSNV
jgi:hypothetical protein